MKILKVHEGRGTLGGMGSQQNLRGLEKVNKCNFLNPLHALKVQALMRTLEKGKFKLMRVRVNTQKRKGESRKILSHIDL